MDFRRLFDLLQYQLGRYPQKNCLSQRNGHRWERFSTKNGIERTQKLAAGLLSLGLKKGDRCALIAPSGSADWILLDLAMQQIGIIVVPIHSTSTPNDTIYILKDAQVKYVFVRDRALHQKIAALKPETPEIKGIYTLQKETDLPWYQELQIEPESSHLSQFQTFKAAIHEDDLATIIYTSGTTGQPKGVMLSHKNIVSNIKAIISLVPVSCDHTVVSFLPLSHVFERMVVYSYMAMGASIYFAPQPDAAIATIQEVRPHYFTSVPRLLEKLYVEILKVGNSKGPLSKKILHWSIRLGERLPSRRQPGLVYWTKLQIANLLVYRHWRKLLGNRVQGVFVGAASLQENLARLFSAAGIHIREGYGLTETSPGVAFNRFDPGLFKFGTVGIPIPGVEIKINEPDEKGSGEIWVKGPNVMLGYLNRPEDTKAVISEDGWFKTGDVGHFVKKRFLKITGRKKDIFKTSSGKYVAPQALENILQSYPLIEHALILGFQKPFVAALIRPNFVLLQHWCEENNVHWTAPQFMVINPKVEAFYHELIDQINTSLESHERIRSFHLIHDEWTIENQDLTPTLKLIRANLIQKYEKEIEKLFQVTVEEDE